MIEHELLRLTDWYVDELFCENLSEVHVVRASVSRLVVDVERFPNDANEPCAAVGMGAVYTKTTNGATLRVDSVGDRSDLMDRYYWPHHEELKRATHRALERFGRCTVVDAHSFPTASLPTQRACATVPEIGIGTDSYHTPHWLRDTAVDFFQASGFSVGVDIPFSGTMVPNCAWQRDRRVASIMIEVRRDLYIDEATVTRLPAFSKLRSLLTEFRELVATRT